MKRNLKDWLKVLVFLVDEAAVLTLVLLALWFFKIKIPLSLAIVGALLFGGFVFLIHKAILPSLRRKGVTGSEGMIGLEGEVVEPLTPFGVIRVEGEYWKAKSVDGNIAVGEKVEILKLQKLTLEVKRKER